MYVHTCNQRAEACYLVEDNSAVYVLLFYHSCLRYEGHCYPCGLSQRQAPQPELPLSLGHLDWTGLIFGRFLARHHQNHRYMIYRCQSQRSLKERNFH